jgi:flagellar hook-basal body complex protein FliE
MMIPTVTPPQPPVPEGIPPIPVIGLTASNLKRDVQSPMSLVGNSFQSTVRLLKESERISQEAAREETDPALVSTTILRARSALDQLRTLIQVTTQAYQEMMRMMV